MKKNIALMLGTAIFGVLFIGNAGYGFNQDDLTRVRMNDPCPQCDLSGADLSEAFLSKKDLDGANLSGANLKYADLSGSDMDGSDLSGANLTGANIEGTDLSGVKLDGATWTDGQKCKSGSIEECIH